MAGFSDTSAYNRQTLRGAVDPQNPEASPPPKYPQYLPVWDRSLICPPLDAFEHNERAKEGDPTFSSLSALGAQFRSLSPSAGTELQGIQLSKMTNPAKNEFALLVATRKVVVIQNQDLRDQPIQEVLSLCTYFGKPSVHPVGPTVHGYPEIHIAHSGGGDTRVKEAAEGRITSMAWHIDGSVEQQPPGLVFLYMLECPETGGDTVFTDTAMAYQKLSPGFQKMLHGLKAEHSDISLVESTRQSGGIAKRDGATAIHPIIRTHPATGQKTLFVNPIYTTRIIGFKKEESDALLKFLFDHIAFSQDCQVRIPWSEGTVVAFDVRHGPARIPNFLKRMLKGSKNRAVCHSAIHDSKDQHRRHLARVALAAEKPYETPFDE